MRVEFARGVVERIRSTPIGLMKIDKAFLAPGIMDERWNLADEAEENAALELIEEAGAFIRFDRNGLTIKWPSTQ